MGPPILQGALGTLLTYKASPRYQMKRAGPIGAGFFIFGALARFLNLHSRAAAQVRVEAGVAGRHN